MKLLIFILFFSPTLFAQVAVQNMYEELPSDSLVPLSLENHSSVLPQIRIDKKISGVPLGSKDKYNIGSLEPLVDLQYRNLSGSGYRAGLGLSFETTIKNKWYLRLASIQGLSHEDSVFSVNSYYFNYDSTYSKYADIRSRISYSPNKIFNFQAGLDHNFIGEGSRSLFLGDYGKPYPFGMIRTKFWRVEYSILYQFFRETKGDDWKRKNGASHHLSLNITKWLNFGLFESVVFQPKDTMLNRGYDAEYLNPTVFYRPQEYAMGSSDNVILGTSLHIKIKHHTIYSQFVLDEFNLTEIRKKSGWWANKYGMQIGVKGRFNDVKRKYFYRTEFNFVRPYTYAHLNSGQNYANQGMSLTHPYGSNFFEILGELKAQQNKWTAKLFVSYFLRGLDKDGYSYGANVYQPYTFRKEDYGNFTGQGLGNNGARANIYVAYKPFKYYNLQCFGEVQLRYDSAYDRTDYMIQAGIRSQLWNDYRNY